MKYNADAGLAPHSVFPSCSCGYSIQLSPRFSRWRSNASHLCLYNTRSTRLACLARRHVDQLFLHPIGAPDGSGWIEFECQLSSSVSQPVRFMLFSFNERGAPGEFESDAFQREFPRLPSGEFPGAVWCAAGCSRVVLSNPRLTAPASIHIHLISQSRFRPSEMLMWDPVTGSSRRITQARLIV